MGSISSRVGIRWGSGDLSEPTDTLVLGSPKRYFVDIRILKTGWTYDADNNKTPEQILPRSSIDWAFAGTSSHFPITLPDGAKAGHSVFKHWVDSRTTHAESVVDEGDMVPSADDYSIIIETGRMVNPATGIDTEYEERWSENFPEFVWGRPLTVLVLQLHDDANGKRGLWVRLGNRAQGVLRVGDKFTAESWSDMNPTSHDESAHWERDFKAGDEGMVSLDDVAATDWSPAYDDDLHPYLEFESGKWKVVEWTTRMPKFPSIPN